MHEALSLPTPNIDKMWTDLMWILDALHFTYKPMYKCIIPIIIIDNQTHKRINKMAVLAFLL